MDLAQQENRLAPTAAQSASGRQAIIRLVGGIAALCLIGVAVTAFMQSGGGVNTRAWMTYPPDLVNGVLAYDVRDEAPTSYGAFTETAVHLSNSEDISEVDVSLTVDNRQLLPMKVPALAQLRVINADGAEATYLSGGWHDDQIVLPHWSASGDFRFAAPPRGGMLLLEYSEHADETPIRIAVGYVLEHPEASI